jgi:hypothetical protein
MPLALSPDFIFTLLHMESGVCTNVLMGIKKTNYFYFASYGVWSLHQCSYENKLFLLCFIWSLESAPMFLWALKKQMTEPCQTLYKKKAPIQKGPQ